MRAILRLVLLTVAAGLLVACSEPPPPPPPPPVAPPFHTILNLKQFMLLVIDPAADGVWESVKTIMTKKGTEETVPKTDKEWTAVQSSAATVAEAANLLMLDGRAKDKTDWMTAARRLTDAAEKAMKAAEAKDAAAVFDAGGEMFNACEGCHLRYQPKPEVAAAPAKTDAAKTEAAANDAAKK